MSFSQIDVYFLPHKFAAQDFNKGNRQQREKKADINEHLQNDGAFIARLGDIQKRIGERPGQPVKCRS